MMEQILVTRPPVGSRDPIDRIVKKESYQLNPFPIPFHED